MKNLAFLLFLILTNKCFAQQNYWQQKADYTIDASLNDKEKTLDCFEKINYTNNSPDTLHFIWFHLWPNAYKNDRTAFSDQLLQNGNTRFYFSSKEQHGYINRLDFKVDGKTAKTEDHPLYIDIIKVILPSPLLPAQQLTITTPFHVKLPYNFSRGGYDNKTFQITQWYPKPAVYDSKGWHEMPYLDQGEFYSEFGDYNVTLTLPKDYVVAATGVLQNEAEINWLRTKATAAVVPAKTFSKPHAPVKKGVYTKNIKQKANATPSPVTETKTISFKQERVHDFALFANKDFIVNSDTCMLPSGRLINVFSYYTPKEKNTWKNSIAFLKSALRFYSNEVGEYPYNIASVVQGPQSFGGGMEYPTITIISPTTNEKDLDITIAHEIGHNWFYGILASNERQHPWMDEGINSFYEEKYALQQYGPTYQFEKILFETFARQNKDQPIETTSENFNFRNYALVAYYKTAQWMALLEQHAGEANFRAAMHQYYNQWQFKHPQPEDFKKSIATSLQQNMDSLFHLLQTKGLLPNQQLTGFKVSSPLIPGSIKSYLQAPVKHMLLVTPAVGFNNYDRFMVGGLITNYKFPADKLQFLAAPLYATGSKKINGIAKLNYSVYPASNFSRVEANISGLSFSTNKSLDSNGNKLFERFYKITPSLKFTFSKTPLSTKEKWVELRTYFIGEKNFNTFVTKSTDNLVYVDSLKNNTRYLNQLTFSGADFRALYPYNYQLQLQQGKDFYRINATANYYFNYAKSGGAEVRLFAAKFGYLGKGQNSFATTIYQPKLLGVTGEEDYTYGNYFLGRSASYANSNAVVKNSGLAAQQIMLRDGGLKLRIDQYDFLQGRSENWVAAINVNTTLPHNLLPIPVPLKLFLDAGTYAEAWDKDFSSSRFLYVGGLQLTLLHNTINIYAPLVYSKVFRDNLKTLPEQNKFFRKVTFSIDLSYLTLRSLSDNNLSF